MKKATETYQDDSKRSLVIGYSDFKSSNDFNKTNITRKSVYKTGGNVSNSLRKTTLS